MTDVFGIAHVIQLYIMNLENSFLDVHAPCALNKKVTISVISHGQDMLLRDFLDDLKRHALESVCRVVVTHNLPSKGIDAELGDVGVTFQQIHNKAKKGFGENHNAAFSYCETEWFAVVNPDIRLDDDVFRNLIASAMLDDAVLGPSLFDPGCGKISSNRGLLTPFEIAGKHFRRQNLAEEIVWLPGAFMLLRSDAYRRVGGFDKKFFLYAEDFDLSARLRLAGWKLRYVPEVQVSHAAQRSSHVRWRYLRWHMASLLRLWSGSAFWQYRALLRREARADRLAAQRLR